MTENDIKLIMELVEQNSQILMMNQQLLDILAPPLQVNLVEEDDGSANSGEQVH